MEGRRGLRLTRWAWLGLLASLAVGGCAPRVDVESLPSPRATLIATGKRLSGSLSAGDLTTLSRRGEQVLRALNRSERDALGRGYLRIRVDRPVLVTVAAPAGSAPFWLDDQGFKPTGLHLSDPESTWTLRHRSFGPGWVGLGVNALDLTPAAHYAVFLQTLDGAPLEPLDVEGASWRVLHAAVGVSLASGIDRPIRDLPPLLRGATLLQPAYDQRHSTPLARGRVWKTHSVATRMPDQITMAFGSDAAHELIWAWRTDAATERSVVRFAAVAPDVSGHRVSPPVRFTERTGDVRSVEVPDLLNDPVTHRHVARAADLEPDTAYAYSVGDGTAAGMSPWHLVRTGPKRTGDVHLMYLGDPQCGLEGWGKLLADARRRHPETGALLIAGDLVDRGNERSNWDHFFLRAAGVFEGMPVLPAVGNHEYLDQGPRLYRAFFELPGNGPSGVEPGLVYAFEYGDAFVAVLDSTLAVTSPPEARRQADWLDEQLGRTRCCWKLLMFHHPLYASHPRRESLSLRELWVPVIDRHRVDLVLQGHDHAYLRTYPLRAGRRVAAPSEGTVYVVSVSGDKYYDQDPRDYTEVGLTYTSTYQTIDIPYGHGQLIYRACDDSGEEVDRLEIIKPVVDGRH